MNLILYFYHVGRKYFFAGSRRGRGFHTWCSEITIRQNEEESASGSFLWENTSHRKWSVLVLCCFIIHYILKRNVIIILKKISEFNLIAEKSY